MSCPTPQRQLRQIAQTLKRIAGELVHPGHARALQIHADALTRLAERITPEFRQDMLTPQQSRVLEDIRQHLSDQGRPPTRREIAQEFGFASLNAAQDHVKALERKGFLTLTVGARGIQINTNPTR